MPLWLKITLGLLALIIIYLVADYRSRTRGSYVRKPDLSGFGGKWYANPGTHEIIFTEDNRFTFYETAGKKYEGKYATKRTNVILKFDDPSKNNLTLEFPADGGEYLKDPINGETFLKNVIQ